MEVDAGNVESAQLTHAKSGAVEHLTDRAVKDRPLIITPVLVEEMIELFSNNDLWELGEGSRRRKPRGRIGVEQLTLHQPCEVAAKGGSTSHDRGPLIAARGHKDQILTKGACGHPRRLHAAGPTRPVNELLEIATIRSQRVTRAVGGP